MRDEQLKYVTGHLSHCFVSKLDRQTNRRTGQEAVNGATDLSPFIISSIDIEDFEVKSVSFCYTL